MRSCRSSSVTFFTFLFLVVARAPLQGAVSAAPRSVVRLQGYAVGPYVLNTLDSLTTTELPDLKLRLGVAIHGPEVVTVSQSLDALTVRALLATVAQPASARSTGDHPATAKALDELTDAARPSSLPAAAVRMFSMEEREHLEAGLERLRHPALGEPRVGSMINAALASLKDNGAWAGKAGLSPEGAWLALERLFGERRSSLPERQPLDESIRRDRSVKVDDSPAIELIEKLGASRLSRRESNLAVAQLKAAIGSGQATPQVEAALRSGIEDVFYYGIQGVSEGPEVRALRRDGRLSTQAHGLFEAYRALIAQAPELTGRWLTQLSWTGFIHDGIAGALSDVNLEMAKTWKAAVGAIPGDFNLPLLVRLTGEIQSAMADRFRLEERINAAALAGICLVAWPIFSLFSLGVLSQFAATLVYLAPITGGFIIFGLLLSLSLLYISSQDVAAMKAVAREAKSIYSEMAYALALRASPVEVLNEILRYDAQSGRWIPHVGIKEFWRKLYRNNETIFKAVDVLPLFPPVAEKRFTLWRPHTFIGRWLVVIFILGFALSGFRAGVQFFVPSALERARPAVIVDPGEGRAAKVLFPPRWLYRYERWSGESGLNIAETERRLIPAMTYKQKIQFALDYPDSALLELDEYLKAGHPDSMEVAELVLRILDERSEYSRVSGDWLGPRRSTIRSLVAAFAAETRKRPGVQMADAAAALDHLDNFTFGAIAHLLQSDLSSPDEQVRLTAILDLEAVQNYSAFMALAQAGVSHPDISTRLLALRVLRHRLERKRSGDEAQLAIELMKGLEDPDSVVIEDTIFTYVATRAGEAELLAMLAHGNPSQRGVAARALALGGIAGTHVNAAVRDAVRAARWELVRDSLDGIPDRQRELREDLRWAEFFTRDLGSDDMSEVRAAARHPQPSIRAAAAENLLRMGDFSGDDGDVLRVLVDDSHPEVRRAARPTILQAGR